MLLVGVLLCRFFREIWGDWVDGICRCGSLLKIGVFFCFYRLGRGVLFCDFRLLCDVFLRDGLSSVFSFWLSIEFYIDLFEVGLRFLVMEFRMKLRICSGDGFFLKVVFWGVRFVFFANFLGFFIRVIGIRR